VHGVLEAADGGAAARASVGRLTLSDSTRRRRPKGEGSIFERRRTIPNGRVVTDWVWVVSLGVDDRGRRVRRWFTGKTKRDVREKVARELAKHGGVISRSTGLTVEQYLRSWLADVAATRSPLTARSYRNRIEAFALPNIGWRRLDELDGPIIAKLYRDLRERGVSADHVQKLRKALRRAFNVAIGQGLLARNPIAHVDAPRHRPQRRAHYDAAQLATFFAAARGHRLEALFRLGVMAALRPGELFALEWADVNLDGGYIDVRHTLEDDQGRLSIAPAKADSARRLPLEPQTVDLLRAHAASLEGQAPRSPYVFTSVRGKWLRYGPVDRELAAIAAGAGLPKITLYGLRHSGISLFAEAGVSLRVAADVAGHATTRMTSDVYTHVTSEMHRNAIETIAELVRGVA